MNIVGPTKKTSVHPQGYGMTSIHIYLSYGGNEHSKVLPQHDSHGTEGVHRIATQLVLGPIEHLR